MENREILRFQDTLATQKIFSLSKRIRAVAGGTAASKTISILVWLIDYSQVNRNKISTVTSESYPHLQDGAMRDFMSIMKDRNYWKDSLWHDTKHTYTFETGSIIEFKSIDTYGKAHGPRRNVLFINECNNIAYNICDQLIVRTNEVVWLDWNPTSEFWFYEEMLPFRNDIDFITLTYLDNEALLDEPGQITLKEIFSHKHDKNWWTVYALGQLGAIETRIYNNWIACDTIPIDAKLVARGLDFGYSNDPTAIIDIYRYKGVFWLNETLYRKGMSNAEIVKFIKSLPLPDTQIFADSVSPKDIDEIALYDLNIIPAMKGQGSVNYGIQYIQSQTIYYTKRSLNLIKEYRNYLWQTNKDGRIINTPEDINNHLLDALRYGLETYIYESQRSPGFIDTLQPLPIYSQSGFTSVNDQSLEPILDIKKLLSNHDQRTWKEM